MRAGYISEPLLEFGRGQTVEHPQDGLFLYGPVETPDKPVVIHVGVVGTRGGIALASDWLARINGPIRANDDSGRHVTNWPGFVWRESPFFFMLVFGRPPVFKILPDRTSLREPGNPHRIDQGMKGCGRNVGARNRNARSRDRPAEVGK